MPKYLAAFCTRICIFYEYRFRPAPTVTTPISFLCYPCTVSGYTVRTLRNTRCNPVLPVAVGCYSTATSVECLHHTWPSICPTSPRRSSPALLRQVVKLWWAGGRKEIKVNNNNIARRRRTPSRGNTGGYPYLDKVDSSGKTFHRCPVLHTRDRQSSAPDFHKSFSSLSRQNRNSEYTRTSPTNQTIVRVRCN